MKRITIITLIEDICMSIHTGYFLLEIRLSRKSSRRYNRVNIVSSQKANISGLGSRNTNYTWDTSSISYLIEHKKRERDISILYFFDPPPSISLSVECITLFVVGPTFTSSPGRVHFWGLRKTRREINNSANKLPCCRILPLRHNSIEMRSGFLKKEKVQFNSNIFRCHNYIWRNHKYYFFSFNLYVNFDFEI